MPEDLPATDPTSVMHRRCAEPRRYFAELRSRGVLDTAEGFEGRVQVLTAAAAEPILADPGLFSSGMEASDHGSARPLIPLQIDPPDHVRYRRLLDPVFAPRNVYPLEKDVAELTNQLIDGFIDDGHADVSQRLAIPLPAAIFLRIFGLPYEGLAGFMRLKDGIIRAEGADADERQGNRARAGQEVYALFEDVIAQRRAEPRDDLISKLVHSEVGGERLTQGEALDICFLLLLGGLDTVSISLQCMFHHLATHPGHRRELAADPTLAPAVVEELLRWETPVQGVSRVAVADTAVGGCPFPRGTRFQVMVASVNTDPDTAPGYDHVDFHRENNRHLAFGGGIHRCLGSHLARVELRTVLREWHRRIPDYGLEPGAEVVWNDAMLRGIDHLHLSWAGSGSGA
jgi:cytochrome P450